MASCLCPQKVSCRDHLSFLFCILQGQSGNARPVSPPPAVPCLPPSALKSSSLPLTRPAPDSENLSYFSSGSGFMQTSANLLALEILCLEPSSSELSAFRAGSSSRETRGQNLKSNPGSGLQVCHHACDGTHVPRGGPGCARGGMGQSPGCCHPGAEARQVPSPRDRPQGGPAPGAAPRDQECLPFTGA